MATNLKLGSSDIKALLTTYESKQRQLQFELEQTKKIIRSFKSALPELEAAEAAQMAAIAEAATAIEEVAIPSAAAVAPAKRRGRPAKAKGSTTEKKVTKPRQKKTKKKAKKRRHWGARGPKHRSRSKEILRNRLWRGEIAAAINEFFEIDCGQKFENAEQIAISAPRTDSKIRKGKLKSVLI